MSWIREIDNKEAEGELKQIYDGILKARGKIANIMKVNSLDPGSMVKHMELYLAIMFGSSELKREERELIAVVVSAENCCEYCLEHHKEALDHYWRDERRIGKLISDPTSASLSERQLLMIKYVKKLTRAPSEVEEVDMMALRASGFTDAEILHMNLITSYFNFVNRIALGLGVEYTTEEVSGYKY